MMWKKLIFAGLFIASCSGTEKSSVKRYADLEGFFDREVIRLEKLKPRISKIVSRNGVAEKKENISPDWSSELSLFSESDINKPAWSDSYLISSDSVSTYYKALDPKLRTRSVHIKKNKDGQIIELALVNKTKNYLYSSSEELLYIPDSLYRISKKQNVVFLGNNTYKISGFFK